MGLHRNPWRPIGIITLTTSAFLLLSMGGAIFAAPVTVPLMFVAARRHPSGAFRWLGAVLVGLTAGEVAWAATYVATGEDQPWILLVPLLASIAVGWALLRSARPTRSPGADIGNSLT